MQKETYKKDDPLFKRIPTKLFNDPIWIIKSLPRKAYLDLFSLAYDADEGKPQRIDIAVICYYLSRRGGTWLQIFIPKIGWSTKKVGNFIRA